MATAAYVNERPNADRLRFRSKGATSLSKVCKSNRCSSISRLYSVKSESYDDLVFDKRVKFAHNISRFVNNTDCFVRLVNINSNEYHTHGERIIDDQMFETEQVIESDISECPRDLEDDRIDIRVKSPYDVSSPGSNESSSSKDSGIVVDDTDSIDLDADADSSGTISPIRICTDFDGQQPKNDYECMTSNSNEDFSQSLNQNNSNIHSISSNLLSHLKNEHNYNSSQDDEGVLGIYNLKDPSSVISNCQHSLFSRKTVNSLFSATASSPRGSPSDIVSAYCENDLNSNSGNLISCKWYNCTESIEADNLSRHITECHVQPQLSLALVRCQWEGCKVYNHESSKHSWLERHVLTHSGTKPFVCIVDGCALRFCSRGSLERHVNSHFNSPQTNGTCSGNASYKSTRLRDDFPTPTKAHRKKKLKRRHCNLVHRCDLFDSRTVKHIRDGLCRMTLPIHLESPGSNSSNTITFRGVVSGRRHNKSDEPEYLLQWNQNSALPNKWITESDVMTRSTCSVPYSMLPQEYVDQVNPLLYRPHRFRRNRRK